MKCKRPGCPSDAPDGFSYCSQACSVADVAIQAEPFDASPRPPRKKPVRVNPMGPGWLFPNELATELRVSRPTVLAWAKADKIPCHRVGPKRILFNLAAVRAALGDQSERDVSAGTDAEHFKQVKGFDRGTGDRTAYTLCEGGEIVAVLIEDADAAEARGDIEVAYHLLKALVRGTMRRANADRRDQGEELPGHPGPGAEARAGEPDRGAEQPGQDGRAEGAGVRGEGFL